MFTKEFIPESAKFPGHWRVTDHHDNRIATCYDADNADTLVRALNAMETDRKARGALAGLAEVAMRAVLIAERRAPLAAAVERGAFEDIADLLRRAILAAT